MPSSVTIFMSLFDRGIAFASALWHCGHGFWTVDSIVVMVQHRP